MRAPIASLVLSAATIAGGSTATAGQTEAKVAITITQPKPGLLVQRERLLVDIDLPSNVDLDTLVLCVVGASALDDQRTTHYDNNDNNNNHQHQQQQQMRCLSLTAARADKFSEIASLERGSPAFFVEAPTVNAEQMGRVEVWVQNGAHARAFASALGCLRTIRFVWSDSEAAIQDLEGRLISLPRSNNEERGHIMSHSAVAHSELSAHYAEKSRLERVESVSVDSQRRAALAQVDQHLLSCGWPTPIYQTKAALKLRLQSPPAESGRDLQPGLENPLNERAFLVAEMDKAHELKQKGEIHRANEIYQSVEEAR